MAAWSGGGAESRTNPLTVSLPVSRDELLVEIRQLKADIDVRQEQLDNQEAARIAAQAHEAAERRDEDLDAIEAARQRREEGLKV